MLEICVPFLSVLAISFGLLSRSGSSVFDMSFAVRYSITSPVSSMEHSEASNYSGLSGFRDWFPGDLLLIISAILAICSGLEKGAGSPMLSICHLRAFGFIKTLETSLIPSAASFKPHASQIICLLTSFANTDLQPRRRLC